MNEVEELKMIKQILTLMIAGIWAIASPVWSNADSEKQKAGDLRLLEWDPVSQLVVENTTISKPKYPVIDIHNHMGKVENAEQWIDQMDRSGVVSVVNLDGRSRNDRYREQLKAYEKFGKDRVLTFFTPDYSGIDDPEWGKKEAAKLEKAVEEGCRGVKIFKALGLTVRFSNGEVVPVDDPRIDPFWEMAGKLGVPVMIHVSDPKAFFTPIDKHNERYDELGAHPDWSFYGDEYPGKDEIIAQRNRVFAKHPHTIFIGAHVGTLPEELHIVGNWLDIYPNFYVDISARISDLGRQPYTARDFFIEYQDRILFGTDTPPIEDAYQVYYRFLETEDEYIDPSGGHHMQARWMIYGVHLPDEVLKKVYYSNAAKILDFDPL